MPTVQSAGRAATAILPASPRLLRRREWRCTRCNRLLGLVHDGQLHIRFARSHEYLTRLPATCTCRSCGTLNRTAPSAA